MPLPSLLKFEDAAAEMNVPVESLRKVADEHGKTIHMGRARRLHPDDIEELIELCRVKAKAPASTGENRANTAPASGRSATTAMSGSQRALAAAKKLRQRSKATSPKSAAPVAPFTQKK